jgi:hypothetical protein
MARSSLPRAAATLSFKIIYSRLDFDKSSSVAIIVVLLIICISVFYRVSEPVQWILVSIIIPAKMAAFASQPMEGQSVNADTLTLTAFTASKVSLTLDLLF